MILSCCACLLHVSLVIGVAVLDRDGHLVPLQVGQTWADISQKEKPVCWPRVAFGFPPSFALCAIYPFEIFPKEKEVSDAKIMISSCFSSSKGTFLLETITFKEKTKLKYTVWGRKIYTFLNPKIKIVLRCLSGWFYMQKNPVVKYYLISKEQIYIFIWSVIFVYLNFKNQHLSLGVFASKWALFRENSFTQY